MNDEPELIVSVDPAVEGDGGIVVAEVADHKVTIVSGLMPELEGERVFLVSDEFVEAMRAATKVAASAFKGAGDAAVFASQAFGVPLHILGIPYVVDRHIAGVHVKGGPFVPLKTGPRRSASRAEWARILRVHRALRRRARRHGTAAPTEQGRIPVRAMMVSPFHSGRLVSEVPVEPVFPRGSMIAQLYGGGGPFDLGAVRDVAARLNRTMFD